MNIKDYGFDYKINSNESIGTPARITAVHKGRFAIVSDFGEGYAQLKGKEYYYDNESFPTVGDFVLIDHNSSGDSRIIKTLERRTYFSRRDPDKGRGEQAVAANFDYVFIMQSLNHDFNPKRLERYLTAARQSKAEPVIVLTKADLTDDYLPYILETSRVAENVTTCIVSAKTGYGMGELSPYLQKGKTLVFLGSSGVGKSSLVNALAGENIMENEEEADLVVRLIKETRSMSTYIPELELIMVNDEDEVIGYALFSGFHLGGKYMDELLLLSPVAVKIEWQRQHISKEIIEYGFEKAKQMGFSAVIVEGNPQNYRSRGFQTSADFGIIAGKSVGLPAPECLMVKELTAGALDRIQGVVEYTDYKCLR